MGKRKKDLVEPMKTQMWTFNEFRPVLDSIECGWLGRDLDRQNGFRPSREMIQARWDARKERRLLAQAMDSSVKQQQETRRL